jgi:ABC-type transport system involved in multi-copper enzyme maturation permease subunit
MMGADQGAARPTFFGTLGGELFKLRRQRVNWLLALLVSAITGLTYIFFVTSSETRTVLAQQPLFGLYRLMGTELAVQRAFIGILLLAATARMVGLEYQQGTIRILLARGVGRLQLLGAKLVTMALVGLALLAWRILLKAAGFALVVQ